MKQPTKDKVLQDKMKQAIRDYFIPTGIGDRFLDAKDASEKCAEIASQELDKVLNELIEELNIEMEALTLKDSAYYIIEDVMIKLQSRLSNPTTNEKD